jgi:hypothetical protein
MGIVSLAAIALVFFGAALLLYVASKTGTGDGRFQISPREGFLLTWRRSSDAQADGEDDSTPATKKGGGHSGDQDGSPGSLWGSAERGEGC